MTIKAYAAKRLLLIIPTVVVVSFIVFIVVHHSIGNFIYAFVNPSDPETIMYVRSLYRVDQPCYIQYFYWLKQIVSGNFGLSPWTGKNFSNTLLSAIPYTLSYHVVVLALSMVIGVPFGVVCAVKKYSKSSSFIMKLSFVCRSCPVVLLGPVIILVCAQIVGWLPEGGAHSAIYSGDTIVHTVGYYMDFLKHLVLPVFTLTIIGAAYIAHCTKSSMSAALQKKYINTLQSHGLPENTIIHHVLRSAFPPVVKALGSMSVAMLGAAPLIESIFKWPGLGKYFLYSMLFHEQFVVLGTIFLLGMLIVIVHAVCDIFFVWLNPVDRGPFFKDFSL
ncbi:MAG: ABC transporter permease [Candidatus Methanofastidiosia archaeon]|jgi:peptide/nickel transport system permease protein